MKKLLLSLPALILVSSISTINAQDITVTLNGEAVAFDQPPIIQDERTLVPLRAIFEAMGASVEWDQETQTVTASRSSDTVSLTIGSNMLYKNDEAVMLDVPAQIVNERTLVPARAVAESFGAFVDWNGETQTVVITDTYDWVTVIDNTSPTEQPIKTPIPTPMPTPIASPAPTAAPTAVPAPTVVPTANPTTAPTPTHIVVEASPETIGVTVWIGETGTKYHHQDCRTLRGNKYEITLEEAEAQGRTPCGVCYK
ncbi:MAG: stalk domain-containing protein [Candidatus Ornithomonoglobus sp.]